MKDDFCVCIHILDNTDISDNDPQKMIIESGIQNIKELLYENNVILLFTLVVSSISLYFYNSDEYQAAKDKLEGKVDRVMFIIEGV